MRKSNLILLAGVFAAVETSAVTPGVNGFGKIAERNVFNLRPIVQTTATNAVVPELPLPRITLTGITTILGNKIALLKVEFPAEKGQKAREDSFMLAEGQRDSGIEILDIDEKALRVRVNNSGTIMPLVFEKDSMKTPGTNSAAQPATARGVVPAANPRFPQSRPGPFQSRPFGRSLRLPGTAAAPNAGAGTTSASAAMQTNPGQTTPPQPAAVPTSTGGASFPQLSPEQEALVQELQRQENPPSTPASLQRPPTMPQLPQ
jgi:hypothetical protein